MSTEIKKVKLNLVGLDGNVMSLMAAFRRQAKKEGWTEEEIKPVIEKCMSGNYDNLLRTLIEVCDDEDGE